MKNLRLLFIGAIAGGAFGAKIGVYLSTILELPSRYQWIEAGFVYGILAGALTVAASLVAYAMAMNQKEPIAYTPENMASA